LIFIKIDINTSVIMKNNTYPNPWDLRYFQEVAATQNLSRAAERLGIGQPALSLSLKRLEDQLGVSLFLRQNRGLKLTDAGARLLKECNRLLLHWEAVVSEARKSQSELVGQYSLGCHPSVGLYALNPLIKNIYEEYSGIEIKLVHGLSRVLTEQVISGKIDFAFVVNPTRHPDLVIHELAKDEVSFWKTSGAQSDVLLYNPDLFQSQTLLKKLKEKTFRRTILSESLEVLAILARSGAGVAILPDRVVGALCPELKKMAGFPTYQDHIAFIYRSDLRKTASAKAVIQMSRSVKI
jgi:LysR family transcriptional regulator, cell division regulator